MNYYTTWSSSTNNGTSTANDYYRMTGQIIWKYNLSSRCFGCGATDNLTVLLLEENNPINICENCRKTLKEAANAYAGS